MLLFCQDASFLPRCCRLFCIIPSSQPQTFPAAEASPLVLMRHSSRSVASPTMRLLSGTNSAATRVHMDVPTMEVDKVACRESTATGKVVLGLAASSNRVNLELEGNVVFEDVDINEAAEFASAALYFIGFCATYLKLHPALLHYEYGFRVLLLKFYFIKLTHSAAVQCVSISAFKEFIHTAATRFLVNALLVGAGMGINLCTLQSWASEELHNVKVQRLRNVAISLEGCVNRPRSWNKYVEILINSASKFRRFISWPAPLSFDADAAESNTYQSTSALSWAVIASLLLCISISGLVYDTKDLTDEN